VGTRWSREKEVYREFTMGRKSHPAKKDKFLYSKKKDWRGVSRINHKIIKGKKTVRKRELHERRTGAPLYESRRSAYRSDKKKVCQRK